MMRVTVGMISKQYNNNLNSSLSRLNYYNNRATSFRKFDQVSEDPLSSSVSFRLRREYQNNEDYTTNLRDVDNMFLTAESSMMSVNKIMQEVASGDCLQAITGTTNPDDRKIIAEKIRELQGSVVAMMNTKYGDQFMFGGTNTERAPFTISESGALLYRGADVNTGKMEDGTTATFGNSVISFGKENGTTFNGYTIQVVDTAGAELNGVAFDPGDSTIIQVKMDMSQNPTKQTVQDLLRGTDMQALFPAPNDCSKITISGALTDLVGTEIKSSKATDIADLEALANEKVYSDLGIGLRFNGKELNEQTVFDSSLAGIGFLGYGYNEDGVPNNVYSLMEDIAKQLEDPEFTINKIQPYLDNFNKSQQDLLVKVTDLGVKSNYLEYTDTRLKDTQLNLTNKLKSIETIDPAEAIMDFKMQEYAYRAALQMGTKILQPTFLDFMR